MLWLATTVKLLAEIALMALLGQWVLGWLAGPHRERNPFYQVLSIVTRPARWCVARLAAVVVGQEPSARHVERLAFACLMLAWLLATVTKIQICLAVGVLACR